MWDVGKENKTLPNPVSSYFTKGNLTSITNDAWDVCRIEEESIKITNNDDVPHSISCSALQNHCEKLNAGWLVFAETFEIVSNNLKLCCCFVSNTTACALHESFFFFDVAD